MDNTNDKIVSIDPLILTHLEEQILDLAKRVQNGTIKDREVYTLIESFMGNRLFIRELFVKTLEGYNSIPNITIASGNLGLDTTTCFNLIDAYDFIVMLKERQVITQSLAANIIS